MVLTLAPRGAPIAPALRAALGRHGIIVGDSEAGPADVVLLIDPDSAAVRAACGASSGPVLAVQRSWAAGRRQVEWIRPPAAASLRFDAIRSRIEHAVGEPEVRAVLPLLPLAAKPRAGDPSIISVLGTGERPGLAEALGHVTSAAESPGLSAAIEAAAGEAGYTLEAIGPGDVGPCPGAVVLATGHDPACWLALACGWEVFVVGPAPAAPVCHSIASAADLRTALSDVESGRRRNHRDLTLSLVAIDGLFASIPDAPDAVAGAIAEACRVSNAPLRISILINAYNYRSYLPAAIRSAQAQTRPACEIVVVDDGSTDGSADIVRDWPGIVAVLKPNGGQASAMNAGMARATGEVIVFLDADDTLHPKALERIARQWRPGLSRLQFGLDTIDAAGRPIGLYPDQADMPRGHLLGPMLASGNYAFVPTSGNAFARTALDAVMPIPEEPWRLCADHYLNATTILHGPVETIPEVLGSYRVHGLNGHFHAMGAMPFRERRHLVYRLRVWRDLMRLLARRGGPQDQLHALRLHRRILHAAFDARICHKVSLAREALAAVRLALAGHQLPLRLRMEHAVLAPSLILRRLLGLSIPTATHELPWPWPAEGLEPAATGGPATWPLLRHGASVDLMRDGLAAGVLGWGWTIVPGQEPWLGRARLTSPLPWRMARERRRNHLNDPTAKRLPVAPPSPAGTMAFLVPADPAHWQVLLWLAGPLPPDLAIACNGEPLRPDPLHSGGVLSVLIPDEVLTSGPDGTRLCALTFSLDEASILRLSGIALRAAPAGTEPVAPYLPVGAPLALGGALAGALGTGWDWPDEDGVALSGLHGRLVIFTDRPGHDLQVRLGLTSGAAAMPAVRANGRDRPVAVSEDSRFATVTLPGHSVMQSGRIEIDVIARNPPGAAHTPVVLRSLQVVDLDEPGGRTLPLDEQTELRTPTAGGWTATGFADERSGLRTTGRPAALTLRLPASCRRLSLMVTRGAEAAWEQPAPLTLLVAGRPIRAEIAVAGCLRLEAPATPPLPVRVDVLDAEPGLILSWLSLSSMAGDLEPVALARLTSGAGLDAVSLNAAVTYRPDWMPPVEDVLWMTGDCATLTIAVADGVTALDVTVLVLPGGAGAFSVMCGDVRIVADDEGPQVLRIPLGLRARSDCEDAALTFRTGLLVSVPEGGSGMIGGGLVSVAAV